MRPHLRAIRLLALIAWLPTLLHAALTPDEARRLDADLTPVGAERAGNADGSIPPWTGGLQSPPAQWQPAMGYVDPFANETPLFEITRANADRYANLLSPGLRALLARNDNFRMPVYPTHRTAVLPKSVTDTARAKAADVTLNGFGLKNLNGSTIPFPIPHNGLEAIWNHLVRYVGGGVERTAHSFPVRANGDTYRIGFHAYRIYDENMQPRTDNRLFSAKGYFTEPASLRGTVFLVHEPVDQVAEKRSAWIYNAGQRRVRRAPDLGYDGINDGSEGLLTSDQVDGYNGAPDRFEWKLVGRKELYVPYNAYRIADKKLKYTDIVQKGTVNPAHMRYELHRVWVVEATLKTGEKHLYSRRTFYLDEDSWNVLIEEAHSIRGDLWRVALHPLVQYYDVRLPGYRLSIYHDLDSGAYLVGGLDNEIADPIRFGIKGMQSEFEPDALRRIADR